MALSIIQKDRLLFAQYALRMLLVVCCTIYQPLNLIPIVFWFFVALHDNIFKGYNLIYFLHLDTKNRNKGLHQPERSDTFHSHHYIQKLSFLKGYVDQNNTSYYHEVRKLFGVPPGTKGVFFYVKYMFINVFYPSLWAIYL